MGDKDDSEMFQHYSPEHPLPNEIRSMRRDSTVCKYCGVSYLIHNEIKMLEDKLSVCEKELELLRGCEQREYELKEQVKEVKTKMENELSRRDKILNNMKLELRETQEKLSSLDEVKVSLDQQLLAANECIKSSQKQHTLRNEQLRVCTGQLRGLKEYCKELRDNVSTSIHEARQDAVDATQNCGARFNQRILDITAERDKLILLNASEVKRLKTAENAIEKLRGEVAVTEDKCIQHEYKSRRLEKQLMEETEELEKTVNKNRTLSIEIEQFHAVIKNKNSSIGEMSTNLKNAKLKHDDSLNKLNETVKTQSTEINRLKSEVSDWSNKYNEQNEANQNMALQHSLSSSEIDNLKSGLLKANQDVENLKTEREMSITAHQTQISDLRESFKNRLADMELWPERLERALSEESKKHQEQMRLLREEMEAAKQEEFQIIQNKHDNLLKKYQSETNSTNSKHQSEISNLKSKLDSESGRWKDLLNEMQERFDKNEVSLRAETQSLKSIIGDMESRLGKLGAASLGQNKVQTEDFVRIQSELIEIKDEYEKVKSDLSRSEEQVASLQETVRRECEERFELTESLSSAREELLAAKGIVGGRLSRNHQANSPPRISSSRLSNTSSGLSPHESLTSSNLVSNDVSSSHTALSPPPPNTFNKDAMAKQAWSMSDVDSSVRKIKTNNSGKIRGNSIAQHRRRIANLLGKQ